jgi:hypothetical protein
MEAVPTLGDLRRTTREKLKMLTKVTAELTGEIQRHFPEVIFYVGDGLPPELGALWKPAQSLDSFDDKKLVPSASRHTVWRARIGEEWFAVKEYKIGHARDLQTCLKEAAVVYRQRHPAIIQIEALFQDAGSNCFYVQMPWYEHGSLNLWVAGDQRPDWPQVRSVLLDALAGLAHLHDNGVLHCDVKPANILVDSRERGRLGDFDISIDTRDRTLAVNVSTTLRATALGMTIDFAAPELQSSNKATKQTDVYAYGKAVLCVQEYCEPRVEAAEGGGARGQTEAFAAALTSVNPKDRPLTEDAMSMPFFTILNDVRRRQTKTCLFCELNGDDSVHFEGIECSEGHFHCKKCVVSCASSTRVNAGPRDFTIGTLRCTCRLKISKPCCASGSKRPRRS